MGKVLAKAVDTGLTAKVPKSSESEITVELIVFILISLNTVLSPKF